MWHGVKDLLPWWRLTVFLTTVIDPSLSLWMTFNVSLIMTLFPLIVIQSFGKNTLRERWKPAMCHKAKNLLLWMTFYRLPYHGYKSSHSFRMTFNGQRSYPLFSKLVADAVSKMVQSNRFLLKARQILSRSMVPPMHSLFTLNPFSFHYKKYKDRTQYA